MTDERVRVLRTELMAIDQVLADHCSQLLHLRSEMAGLKERRAGVVRQLAERRRELRAEEASGARQWPRTSCFASIRG